MSTVYTAVYTDQALAKARAPLAVPNTKKSSFQLGFTAEGFLDSLVVYQLTGTPTAFEVELLTSLLPFPPGDYANAASPAVTLEPFRVQIPPTGPLSAGAGAVLTLATDEIGMSFRNLDGSVNDPQNYLYLLINPTAAVDATTWCAYLRARREDRR